MAEINKKREYSTSDFRGVNTAALRQAIAPGEQAWLENIQPIGPANAKSVAGMTSAILQIPGGATPYYAQGFNIIISGTSTNILIVADTTGDVWAVNLDANTLLPISLGTAFSGNFTKTSAAQWKNERVVFVDGVTGMYDWDGSTLTGPAGFTDEPATGQCIASFSGRIWVSNNRTVYFTGPNLYNDFRTASDGGSFVLTDETLHSSVQQLTASSNFLYIFGIDSCNVISDVRVASGTTVFTNTNLSTGVGTAFPMSVETYGRSIWFASANGFYAMYGASARKESTKLDGMYLDIQNVTTPAAIGDPPTFSAGLVTINNILCIAFLFKYTTASGGVRPLMALFFDDKWFFGSQGNVVGVGAPTLIAGCSVKGKNNLYAFDSTGSMYQLFENASVPVPFQWKTALWDFEQPIMYKQVTKAGVGVYFTGQTSSVTLSVENEENQDASAVFVSSSITFVGIGPITFIGLDDAPIVFLSSGYNLFQTDISQFGRYVGYTITGSAVGATFTLALMEYNLRSQWGT